MCMDREKTFWSVVTAVALVALLLLLASDKGLFDSEDQSSSDQDSGQEDTKINGTQTVLNSSADAPDPLAFECVQHGEQLSRHDHVTLRVFINGEQQLIESAVGIQTDVCNGNEDYMHAIHTHDDTGRLHIELNDAGDISLGVFFDIWGYHFDETGIFDYRSNSTHGMAMHVFASDEAAAEENLVSSFDDYMLQNGEIIEVHYRLRSA
jgi:hypothetical protein